MYDVLFRGKKSIGEPWRYGNYNKVEFLDGNGEYEHFIIEVEAEGSQYKIDPKSAGQYIGLSDKNGNKVFENDILKDLETNTLYIVEYDPICAMWELWYVNEHGVRYFTDFECTSIEYLIVVGNTYDNPELSKIVSKSNLTKENV